MRAAEKPAAPAVAPAKECSCLDCVEARKRAKFGVAPPFPDVAAVWAWGPPSGVVAE